VVSLFLLVNNCQKEKEESALGNLLKEKGGKK
jgi:hypothetical protein